MDLDDVEAQHVEPDEWGQACLDALERIADTLELHDDYWEVDLAWETMQRRTAERIYAGIILARAIHGAGHAPSVTEQKELAAQAWGMAGVLVAYGQGDVYDEEQYQQMRRGSDTPPADRPPAV